MLTRFIGAVFDVGSEESRREFAATLAIEVNVQLEPLSNPTRLSAMVYGTATEMSTGIPMVTIRGTATLRGDNVEDIEYSACSVPDPATRALLERLSE